MSIYGVLKSKTAIIIYILISRWLALGILSLVLPLYVTSIGRSAAQWGVLSAAFAFGMIFAEPTWGWISDRVGIFKPLLISQLVYALLIPLFILTGSMGALLAVQLPRGAFGVAVGVLGRKALAYSLGPGKKGMGIGLFQTSMIAGTAVGPLLGGYVLDRGDYPSVFILCSVLSLVTAFIIASNRAKLSPPLDQGLAADVIEPKALPTVSAMRNKGFYLSFSVLALIAICLCAAMGAGNAFVPLLGTSVLGLQASQVALILAVTSTVSGLFALVLGGMSDRLGRSPLVVGGLLLLGISLVGYGHADGIISMAIFILLFSIGVAAAMPAVAAWVSDITPLSRQGQMLGLYGSFEDVGVMVGPLICGFLWDASGPRPAFVVCGLIAVIGVGLALFIREKGTVANVWKQIGA
jgi:MFS family permease